MRFRTVITYLGSVVAVLLKLISGTELKTEFDRAVARTATQMSMCLIDIVEHRRQLRT